MAQKNNPVFRELKVAAIAVSVIIGFSVIYIYTGHKAAPIRKERKIKQNKKYFDGFNESFQGVIIDIKVPKEKLRGGVKLSLLKVKLNYSTIRHYDPRDSLKHYYCLIDYPYAEIVKAYGLGYISIGDSLYYDGIYDTCYIKLNSWGAYKPDIRDNNIQLIKPFWTIPKYSKRQLKERKKNYPQPLDIPNDYYMLLYMKTSSMKKLKSYFEKLEEESSGFKTVALMNKYIERRGRAYYLFYNDKRYRKYNDAVKAWKTAEFKELYIVKFDKHNKFIKIMEKRKITQ